MPTTTLDRCIVLQAPAHTRDPAYGSELQGWETLGTVWALST